MFTVNLVTVARHFLILFTLSNLVFLKNALLRNQIWEKRAEGESKEIIKYIRFKHVGMFWEYIIPMTKVY